MKITLKFLMLLPLLWTQGVWAVDCSSGYYRLTTQAEVDALGGSGCDEIGGLRVENTSDINNLDALFNITSIVDSLEIQGNAALTNLDGLINLTSVGGALFIVSNNALTNLDGLANLTSVGYLRIWSNAALTNVDGLVGLTNVEGSLSIGGFRKGNGELKNIDGLASLTYVGGDLMIEEQEKFTDLDGLASLTAVGGGLQIGDIRRGLPALENVHGLSNLTSVGGFLRVQNNAALTNLDGLANITSIGDSLDIQGNAALTNLDGLANITSVGGYLYIEANDALTDLDGLANVVSIGGSLDIRNSALTTLDGLANLTSIGGYLRIRSNHVLTNLDGLANITNVRGTLEIYGNSALTNLDGLANITNVRGTLEIYGNSALTNLNGLANISSVGGNLDVRYYSGSCEGLAALLGWPNGPPEDNVGGEIIFFYTNCSPVEQILASVSGPTKSVINSAAATGDASINLEFSSSTTTDTAYPITGYEAACVGSSANPSEAPATPLLDNTPITRTLAVSGYDPVATLSDIEVDIDITHSDPADLHITLTTPQGTNLVLWDQGGSGDEDIVGTFPTTLIPIDAISTVGRQAMDGDWVLTVEDVDVGPLVREGVLNAWGLRITEELAANDSGSPIELLEATRGRDYSCTVAPVTGLGVLPVSAPYFVTVPPPTISDSFNSLLQTVQNVRGTGSSQQQATSEASADAGVVKQEGATVQARTAVSAGEPASIPAVPHYLLLIMSSLLGLFGLRRLRA